MKKILLMVVLAVTLTAGYGSAQMGGGMMGSQQESMKSYQQQPSGTGGAAPGYGMHRGYGSMGCDMGHSMMGYGGHMMGHCRGLGYGMHRGYGSTGCDMGHGMMGYGGHMMGSGYGGHMHGWSGGYDQKFLDETVDLRRELHSKKFDYYETVRNPKADADTVMKLEKEIRTLKEKLHEKTPRGKYGRCW